jgi:hypothetical protein
MFCGRLRRSVCLHEELGGSSVGFQVAQRSTDAGEIMGGWEWPISWMTGISGPRNIAVAENRGSDIVQL